MSGIDEFGWQGRLELAAMSDEPLVLQAGMGITSTAQIATPQATLYRRAWVLLVVDQAERYGRTPMARGEIHALTYLSNVLAPVFDVLAPDRAVMKSGEAPFFPAVQWELDRLAAFGFVDLISEARDAVDSDWSMVGYGCTNAGRDFARQVLAIPRLAAAAPFIAEVVAAYATAEDPDVPVLTRVDATYGVDLPNGSVIDYGEWDPASRFNFSLRTTEAFDSGELEHHRFSPRDRVHLYMKYLERVSQKAS
jgi:hypothetical protein